METFYFIAELPVLRRAASRHLNTCISNLVPLTGSNWQSSLSPFSTPTLGKNNPTLRRTSSMPIIVPN